MLPWLISFGLFMENLDSTVINTAIPQMAQSLTVNPLTLKLAITSYLVSLVLFMPISGYLADKLGTKRIFISAITIFTLGSLLCSLASSLSMLIIARIIQGLGGAMMVPTGRLILIKTFEKSAMVNALSNMAIIGQIGPAFGPVLGGALTSYLSWHWVFFINLPIGALGVFFACRWITHNHTAQTPPFDTKGFILFGFGLIAINLFLTLANNPLISLKTLEVSLILGIISLISYYFYAKNKTDPMISFTPFKTRTFKVAVLGSLWVRITANSFPFILPLLLQINFGYSAFVSGMLILPYGLGLISAKFLIKPLLKRFGYRQLLLINPCVIAVISLAFACLNPSSPKLLIIFLCFLGGMACSVQFSSMQTLNYIDIQAQEKSKATSLASLSQQLAVNLGVCFTAFSLGYFNTGPQTTISLHAFHSSFTLLALIAASSTIIFQMLKKSDGSSAVRAT
ncbi:MFS transporter [Piscirickettsia litoralis]|uniref:MFS transporter n=1 Tax=Piscirickettsia litoralis TaxID=1891921 RepID=A0ABX3A3Y5_9GAMM|nr:MFS transporter [Piscirickettsia litoralis]ODN42080.1 MFS transporter [Piscirickettsia litoralis]